MSSPTYGFKNLQKILSLTLLGVILFTGCSATITYAQSYADKAVSGALTKSRGFSNNTTDMVTISEFPTDLSATFHVPVVKKDGSDVKYRINVAEYSSKDGAIGKNEIVITDQVSTTDSNQVPYKIVGNEVVFTITFPKKNTDLYLNIEPSTIDGNSRGNALLDYRFNLAQAQSKKGYKGMVATSDSSDIAGDNRKTIVDLSCVWDKNLDDITISWTNKQIADTIQIRYKPGTEKGTLIQQGSPRASDEKFTFKSTAKKIPYLQLKPFDTNGQRIGEEYTYECKPDAVAKVASIKDEPIPTTPKKVITKVPHTGPAETTGILVLITLALYGAYRKLSH